MAQQLGKDNVTITNDDGTQMWEKVQSLVELGIDFVVVAQLREQRAMNGDARYDFLVQWGSALPADSGQAAMPANPGLQAL